MHAPGPEPRHSFGLKVFSANLDAPPLPQAFLFQLLTPEERQRASRFRGHELQRRWTTSRGLLRSLLGVLLHEDPRRIQLESTPEGKPYLPEGPSFNLSHAGPHLLVAVASRGEVGVDIELHRPRDDLDALVTRYFAPQEAAEIERLPASERSRAFLRTWVRKEAFLKGLGLGLPLSSFVVSTLPWPGNALRSVSGPGIRSEGWQIISLPSPPDTEAALAWNIPDLVPILEIWPSH